MTKANKHTLAEDLNALTQRRKALEDLISFAQQLAHASKGLDSVKKIVRPSQRPTAQERSFLQKLIKRLNDIPKEELEKRLKLLDKQVQSELKTILEIAGMEKDSFIEKLKDADEEAIKDFHSKLQKQLKEFRRKAQTDLAIRLELFDRGVQVEAADLGVSQENIFNQLEVVKRQEAANRKEVKKEMTCYIEEIDKVLNNENYPDAIKLPFLEAKVGVVQSLEDLKNGRDIDELSSYIQPVDMGEGFFSGGDEFEVESKIADRSDETPQEKKDKEASAEVSEKKVIEKKASAKKNRPKSTVNSSEQPVLAPKNAHGRLFVFFKTCSVWLATPAKVSWRSAKRHVQKKLDDE